MNLVEVVYGGLQMKVYFQGNFWGHMPYERAGKAIILNQRFEWDGYQWIIPVAYLCSKGLVLDFCRQIPLPRIQNFLKSWKGKAEANQLSSEEREMIEYDNPMSMLINIKAFINKRAVAGIRMCGICWNPLQSEEGNVTEEAATLMEEYQCDKECGWQFIRAALPWPNKRRPQKVSLTLNIEPYTMPYPCGQGFLFQVSEGGKQLEVIHPISKKVYMLQIDGMKSEVISEYAFREQTEIEFPKCYANLSYHFEEEAANKEFVLRDCTDSDRPRRISKYGDQASRTGEVGAIGIIGGASGVGAIFLPGKAGDNHIQEWHTASSLHFAPISQVEWRISAVVKRGEPLMLKLIDNLKI